MGNLSRQYHMIQAIERGLLRAREAHTSAKTVEEWLDALGDELPLDENDNRPMTLERAAFIAALYIAWRDAGSPEI